MIHHINKIKDKKKSHDHLNRCSKKVFDKIQHLSMTKMLHKLGTEGMHLNIIKPNVATP